MDLLVKLASHEPSYLSNEDNNHSNGSIDPANGLNPSILIGDIHLGIVIASTVVVSLLFVFVYIQLIAILCLGYKLVSYQTIFLFDILLWASLRLTMYSFYYYNCCELVNSLSVFPHWLLMSLPSVLLYFALALLVHYFGVYLLKVVERRQENCYLSPSYRLFLCLKISGFLLWALSLVVFLVGSVVLSALIDMQMLVIDGSSLDSLRIARVFLLEGLLLVMGIVLGIFIMVIFTTRAGKDIMEAKQLSKWEAVVLSVVLIILFCSRVLYNTVAVNLHGLETFGYAKKFSTDLADFDSSKEGDIVYFTVMLLWEVVPICLIVFFFRIRSTSSVKVLGRSSMDSLTSDHLRIISTSKDSNDFGSINKSSNHISVTMRGQQYPPALGGYGSIGSTPHYSVPHANTHSSTSRTPSIMPGTTPPQLFTGSPSVFSDPKTMRL